MSYVHHVGILHLVKAVIGRATETFLTVLHIQLLLPSYSNVVYISLSACVKCVNACEGLSKVTHVRNHTKRDANNSFHF